MLTVGIKMSLKMPTDYPNSVPEISLQSLKNVCYQVCFGQLIVFRFQRRSWKN